MPLGCLHIRIVGCFGIIKIANIDAAVILHHFSTPFHPSFIPAHAFIARFVRAPWASVGGICGSVGESQVRTAVFQPITINVIDFFTVLKWARQYACKNNPMQVFLAQLAVRFSYLSIGVCSHPADLRCPFKSCEICVAQVNNRDVSLSQWNCDRFRGRLTHSGLLRRFAHTPGCFQRRGVISFHDSNTCIYFQAAW